MIFNTETPPPCAWEPDLFYSPEEDGRTENGRIERESLAGIICNTECPLIVACLHRSLVRGEFYGVWGGMGEGERRSFKEHLLSDGYRRGEYPEGKELRSAMVHFYEYMKTPTERLHGEFDDEELLLELQSA